MAAPALFLGALVLYLGACVALGAWATRRAKGDAFLDAGGRLGPALVVLSLIAAWTGAGSVVGGVGFAYTAGLGYLWLAGDILGVLALVLLASRIRGAARFTVPELLERRYGPSVRVASALVAAVAYTAIAGTQGLAGGRLLEAAFGLPLPVGAAVFVATFVAYTAAGGLLGVALVAVLQGLLMFAGLAVLLVAGTVQAGGVGAVLAAQPAQAFEPLASVGWSAGLSLHLATLLLLVSDQSTWQRLFAARDARAARVGVRGFLVLVVLLNLFFLGLGLVARALVPGLPPDQASLALVDAALGDVGAAFVYVAFAAIVMSTASAYFLSASSNLAKDVAPRLLGREPGAAASAWIARAAIVAMAAGATALALTSPGVLRLALFAYYVYVTGVAVPVLAALLWPRATASGALAAVLAGFAVTVGWTVAGSPWGLEPVLPALAAALLALVGVSLATPPPDPARVAALAPATPVADPVGRTVAVACGLGAGASALVAFAALPRSLAAVPFALAVLLAAGAGAFAKRSLRAPARPGDARAPAWLAGYAVVAVVGLGYHAAFGNARGAVVLAAAGAGLAAWAVAAGRGRLSPLSPAGERSP